MKRKQKKILELDVIDVMLQRYPDIVNRAYNQFGILDVGAIRKYAKEEEVESSYLFFYAALNWREHKQIFEFDEDICAELCDNNSLDEDIPVEVLSNLPYNCFFVRLPKEFITLAYIKTKNNRYDERQNVYGFYYFALNGVGTFVVVLENRATVSLCFDLSDKNKSIREAFRKYTMPGNEDTYNLCNKLMQLVLYICASNADIQENPAQKRIYRRPQKRSEIKNRFSEIRKWNVGFRYGDKLRKAKKRYEYSDEQQSAEPGTKKRPHSRRAHYHHFWTGSKYDPSQRKLVLKWLAPMLIHGDQENYENEAVIHRA